jgi:hypothetical protein
MSEIIKTRRLKDGLRLAEAWCAVCNSRRWIASGGPSACPCTAAQGDGSAPVRGYGHHDVDGVI